MKIAVVGDLHWGARNDNQEFLNYFQRFFDNVFFPELEERGVNQVLQVGDFVDRRKFISFVTLNHVREKIFGESHKRGISWDILVGNHDTPYKNTNEINSLQELFSQYRGKCPPSYSRNANLGPCIMGTVIGNSWTKLISKRTSKYLFLQEAQVPSTKIFYELT